jgi:calcineurin-like phosphoesterase family protein
MKIWWMVVLAACSASEAKKDRDTAGITRDWSAHPAIVEVDSADEIYALSDPHGGYVALGNLLATNKLIGNFSQDPLKADKATWTGGSAILVVAGDLIDKGPESLGVIDLLRALEKSAAGKGGRVVVTMGNHEAEFFADPNNKKATSTGEDADGIDNELSARGIKPVDLAGATDAAGRGRWLMDLPLGVRIKKWFFAHGGNTAGASIADLDKRLRSALTDHGFGAKDITGKQSILEAQEWYSAPDAGIAATYAKALGVKHIVFGHDPGAFGEHGHILANKDGSLVKIDVMMGLKDSRATTGGLILHIRTKGNDTAEVLDARGKATPLL